jgi:hypothetical protein
MLASPAFTILLPAVEQKWLGPRIGVDYTPAGCGRHKSRPLEPLNIKSRQGIAATVEKTLAKSLPI